MGIMSYPGGKHGPGVFQRLINEIPPHDTYIAGFAGHDAIARMKRPAARTILVDLDRQPLDWWAEYLADKPDVSSSFELHNADAMAWLSHRFGLCRVDRYRDAGSNDFGRTFVFLDPPYLMETRSSRPIYNCEMTTEDHIRLLEVANGLPCPTLVCGYRSDLYGDALSRWRHFTYQSVCRSGAKRVEHAWANYPAPETLHDSRWVGNDKREREKIRKRTRRLVANLGALSAVERQAVLDGLGAIRQTSHSTCR